MRLATAVGQTHGCYFLNKLSFLWYFVISTWFFSSFNPFMFFIPDDKNINYFRKKAGYIYLLHIFASNMYKYTK